MTMRHLLFVVGALAVLSGCSSRPNRLDIVGISDALNGRLSVVLPETIRGREIRVLPPGNSAITRIGKGQSFVITCNESSLTLEEGVIAINPAGVIDVSVNSISQDAPGP